jgi:hypothetical protein
MIRMLDAAEGPDSPLLKQIRDAMQSECGCAQASLF